MANVSDYLTWRGDLPFETDGLNAVDALIFANFSYLQLPMPVRSEMTIREFSQSFFDQDNLEQRCIFADDYRLLEQALETRRFSSCRMVCYRDVLINEEDTQFAAETWILSDGTLVLAFRGTDNTITGWKEDFNMSYLKVVPSQRMALEYTREVLGSYGGPAILTGHSKGGNLAMFAAANVGQKYRSRIQAVYNMDGPGFLPEVVETEGYQAILPKLHTFIPQSSLIGMLLEHREETTIIHSTQLGLMQHNLHSWQVCGNRFETRDVLTAESIFLTNTVRAWVNSMDDTRRSRVVEEIFGLIEAGGAKNTADLLKPATIYKYLKSLSADENARRAVAEDLHNLLHIVREQSIN